MRCHAVIQLIGAAAALRAACARRRMWWRRSTKSLHMCTSHLRDRAVYPPHCHIMNRRIVVRARVLYTGSYSRGGSIYSIAGRQCVHVCVSMYVSRAFTRSRIRICKYTYVCCVYATPGPNCAFQPMFISLASAIEWYRYALSYECEWPPAAAAPLSVVVWRVVRIRSILRACSMCRKYTYLHLEIHGIEMESD